MKAAIEALPYERPRLAVTAMLNGGFAAQLEKALERSGNDFVIFRFWPLAGVPLNPIL